MLSADHIHCMTSQPLADTTLHALEGRTIPTRTNARGSAHTHTTTRGWDNPRTRPKRAGYLSSWKPEGSPFGAVENFHRAGRCGIKGAWAIAPRRNATPTFADLSRVDRQSDGGVAFSGFTVLRRCWAGVRRRGQGHHCRRPRSATRCKARRAIRWRATGCVSPSCTPAVKVTVCRPRIMSCCQMDAGIASHRWATAQCC